MKKLVRDFIPDILKEVGSERDYKFTKILPSEERLRLSFLAEKLKEEAGETADEMQRSDFNTPRIIQELADVDEVMNQILRDLQISRDELSQVREAKFLGRGGFIDFIILEDQT